MNDLEKIATLDNEAQAQLLASILTEQSIPHVIRSYHDSAYDGIFQHHLGWGHIEVAPGDKGQVLMILDELRSASPADENPS